MVFSTQPLEEFEISIKVGDLSWLSCVLALTYVLLFRDWHIWYFVSRVKCENIQNQAPLHYSLCDWFKLELKHNVDNIPCSICPHTILDIDPCDSIAFLLVFCHDIHCWDVCSRLHLHKLFPLLDDLFHN
jgi:hypothetical protein